MIDRLENKVNWDKSSTELLLSVLHKIHS
jgi:hypothetical protein